MLKLGDYFPYNVFQGLWIFHQDFMAAVMNCYKDIILKRTKKSFHTWLILEIIGAFH